MEIELSRVLISCKERRGLLFKIELYDAVFIRGLRSLEGGAAFITTWKTKPYTMLYFPK